MFVDKIYFPSILVSICNVVYLVCLQKSSKGEDVLNKVCDYLNLLEKDYFGLSFRDRDDSRVRLILFIAWMVFIFFNFILISDLA